MLQIKQMARSVFYYHLSRLKLPDKHSSLRHRIVSIYNEHKGRYGYRRITMQLRNEGIAVNHKTVEKLMREIGIKSLVRVKKYRSYRGQAGKIAENVIKKDFVSTAPNQKWATDVTEFDICGVKQYLSPVIDLYNGEIISYTLSLHPNLLMVTYMMNKVIKKIDDNKPILHSDQGWQYQHFSYQNMLRNNDITQSMSRKGNCLDNAVMENFFGILKSELLYLQKFSSIDQFQKELKEYIRYYNNDRIKAKLKAMSPVKYRTHSLKI